MYESQVSEIDSRIVVEFRGEISTIHHADFRDDYNEICRRLSCSENKQIILDLSHTTFFSSLFVGIIVKLSMDISRQGGVLILCGLSDELKQLMNKLLLLERHGGFENRLKHYPTREVAFASLATRA